MKDFLKDFFKQRKMLRNGLLPPSVAEADAFKLIVSMVQSYGTNPELPGFAKVMSEHSEWISVWVKEYYPKIEKALEKPDLVSQLVGLRVLAMDCVQIMNTAICAIWESENPWIARPDEDIEIIGKAIRPQYDLEEFKQNENGLIITYSASQVATEFLLRKYFEVEPDHFNEAFRFVYGNHEHLRMEKMLCEAKGSIFNKQGALNKAELLLCNIYYQAATGREFLLDDTLKSLCPDERKQSA